MKRAFLTILLFTAMTSASGQGYRSMTVWSNGVAKDYPLVTFDSLAVAEKEGKATFYYNRNQNYSKPKVDSISYADIDSITVWNPEVESTNRRTVKELILERKTVTFKKTSYKKVGNHNPLMGHKFGADPFGMVDGDRLYVYMTDDHIYNSQTGQPVPDSDYGDCKNVTIISSDDLVNWTDHGSQPVAGAWGAAGPAKWATNMWAPCAAHKTINGKEKYFLYFADASNGIGVLTADSPYGPWKQPSGMDQLISRNTSNCGYDVVTWLFDPAVLIDDDGKAYLYFGGGVPSGKEADPGTARCVQLGDNMTSIVGTPKAINPPYLFEDAGINKIGGKYVYSYCSNWTNNADPGVANIAYMVSDNPLGTFTYVGRCFDNPVNASWSGGGGNNHHAIIKFKGKYYILYHNRSLKTLMMADNSDISSGMEVRSSCLSPIKVDEETATITNLSASEITAAGVSQIKNFDPYREVPGPTMAWVKDVTTKYNQSTNVCTAELKSGSWIGLSKVDFGQDGPVGFTAKVKGQGILAVSIDSPSSSGTLVAIAEVDSPSEYTEIRVPLVNRIKKVQDELYITSTGNLSLESWSLIK